MMAVFSLLTLEYTNCITSQVKPVKADGISAVYYGTVGFNLHAVW